MRPFREKILLLALLLAPFLAMPREASAIRFSSDLGFAILPAFTGPEHPRLGLHATIGFMDRSRWSPYLMLDMGLAGLATVNPGAASHAADRALGETSSGSAPLFVSALVRSPITFGNELGRLAFGLTWLYLDTRFPAVSSMPNAVTVAALWERPLGPQLVWKNFAGIAFNGVGALGLAIPVESSVYMPRWRWGGPQAGVRLLYIQSFSNGGGSAPSFFIPSLWLGMKLDI